MNNIISLLGTVPPATSAGPTSLDDLMWLFAALGLSTTAGLRAYLPLLAIGVSYYIDPNLLPLQSNFQLLHDPLVLGVLLVLTVVEFLLDKAPGIDHLSDIIHTIIRPASGAIIMAGTHNTLSDVSPWLAAAAGALLALSLHGVKATTRPVVTGTTVGHGNPVVSVIEDVLALGGTVLLLVLPLIGFIVVTIVLLLLLRLTRPLRRRLFGLGRRGRSRGAGGVAPTAPVVAASPPPGRSNDREQRVGGLIGRAARRRAGSPAAAVPSPSPAASAYGPIPLPIPGPAPAAGAVAGHAAGALGGAAAGVVAGAAAGLGAACAAAAAAGLGAAGAAAGPGAGSAATAPTAPLPPPGAAPLPAGAAGGMGIGTGTGDTTVQATNQAPYPPVAPNPVQPLGGQQAQMPTTTQPYPQPFPTPSQPPWNYPGNAPTLPGQQQP